jgi:DNA-binding transcriptional MerR regulator
VTRVRASAADTVSDPAAGFTVADAARRVGIATSTLRSWERRYGLQPSQRTEGGHRRYSTADVADLQRLRRLIDSGMATGNAAALTRDGAGTSPPRPPKRGHRSQDFPSLFADAVASLDANSALRAADGIVSERGAIAAWTTVFMPHLQAAGQLWEGTGGGAEREHLAAAAIQSALTRHALRQSDRQSPVRMVAAATPNERHTLPLAALAAALAESGVTSCVLGTLPPRALRAAVEDTAPAVLVLWARSRETRDSTELRNMAGRAPAVFAAGPGWQPNRLPSTVTHLPDLSTAVESVLAWTR